MKDQSKGTIYMAQNRQQTEGDRFRSLQILNATNDHERKRGRDGIHCFSEDTLGEGKTIQFTIQEDVLLMLLPVVGGINYSDSLNRAAYVQAGDFFSIGLTAGSVVSIANPFQYELVNYLQIQVKYTVVQKHDLKIKSFELKKEESLIELFSQNGLEQNLPKLMIAQLNGRKELTYTVRNKKCSAFVFIVQGAFEVQYRLLEKGDGLALWNTDAIEIESLSNEAIILFLEMMH